jgi:hypothetical protein
MAVILRSSTVLAPGSQTPRWEIGHFFVNLYYVHRVAKYGDQRFVDGVADSLVGCLGTGAPMFVNQWHPSRPPENVRGSQFTGTTEEMHDTPHTLGHFHVELIGANRDTGFVGLGKMDVLVAKLDQVDWG